jgi:hypothetical protein
MPPPHRVAYAIERLPGGEAGERMAPMSGWWLAIVLVLAVVVTLGYLYLRTRGPGAPGLQNGLSPGRDFRQDRETARSNQMSEADRTWESETMERDRQAREGRPLDPEP